MITKILVLDDASSDRKIIASMLKDYEVYTGENGLEGLQRIEEHGPFDLVILDINMPVMNGFEFLEELEKRALLPRLRVLILTNYDEVENELKGLRMGAVDYIRKPVHIESLHARIEIHRTLMTMQRKLEDEYANKTIAYNKIFEEAPLGIAVSFNPEPCLDEKDNENFDINPMYSVITGRSKEDLRRNGWIAITHPEDVEENLRQYRALLAGEVDGYTMDKRILKPDGTYVWVNMVVSRTNLVGELKYNHLSLIKDITLRKEAEENLKEAERSKGVLLSHLPGLAYRCKNDAHWTMEFVSDGAKTLTGYTPEELVDNKIISFNALIAKEYQEDLRARWDAQLLKKLPFSEEYEILHKSGKRVWVMEMGQGVYDEEGQLMAIEGIILDVSERKKIESHLKYQMDHDRWTGLYNQNYMEKMLLKDLSKNDGSKKALLAINLNYVHFLNLVYGFHYTQDLMKKVAETLLLYANEERILFKMHDNQFVFYFKDKASKEELTQFAKDIHLTLEHVLMLERVDLGIGVMEYLGFIEDDVDRLLKRVLIASERALKRGEELPLAFFGEEMEEEILREDYIKKELAQITDQIKPDRLKLYYQPIIRLEDERIVGFEALARLDSSKFGMVSPLEFIAIAEKTKLIIPLGEIIMDMALKFVKDIRDKTQEEYTVSINVSPIQLLKEDFCDTFLQALMYHGVPARAVHLEVTETVFSNNYEDINDALGALKAQGIVIALDDFGTGYSSLARERELNINCLKIDKSFIDKLLVHNNEDALTGDIITMAHRLGHTVVAEGVEEEQQITYLQKYHCDMVQGYYYYKPMREEEAVSLALSLPY